MITNVYAAKAALFARLTDLAAPGWPLQGLQVAYAWPGSAAQPECIYGGGVRFSHEDVTAERGVLVDETALVSVYIRVQASPPVPVQDTDARAAEIGGRLAAALIASPSLGGQLTFLGIGQGQGDYETTDTATTSTLALQVQVETVLGYGSP